LLIIPTVFHSRIYLPQIQLVDSRKMKRFRWLQKQQSKETVRLRIVRWREKRPTIRVIQSASRWPHLVVFQIYKPTSKTNTPIRTFHPPLFLLCADKNAQIEKKNTYENANVGID